MLWPESLWRRRRRSLPSDDHTLVHDVEGGHLLRDGLAHAHRLSVGVLSAGNHVFYDWSPLSAPRHNRTMTTGSWREIQDTGAVEMVERLRTGATTPREAVEASLAAIDERDAQWGAFTYVARSEAHSEVERWEKAGSGPLGPLCGLPVAIKDLTPVAGMPWARGSATTRERIAAVDGGAVKAIRAAGGIVIGKTAVPEWGLSAFSLPGNGPPVGSPADPGRTAGGSSSGSAAALAAHMVALAHGTDGAGSARIPAACCGVVGMRPSRGLIEDGTSYDMTGFGTDGALARSVADCALLLTVMSRQTIFLERPVRPLRIGWWGEPLAIEADVDADVLRTLEVGAGLLEGLGHTVQHLVSPLPPGALRDPFNVVWSAGAWLNPVPKGSREGDLLPVTAWLRERGKECSLSTYAAAITTLRVAGERLYNSLSEYDILVTPTLSHRPPTIDDIRHPVVGWDELDAQARFTPWAAIYNITGQPSLSLPVAPVTGGGPPISLLLAARRGQEAQLLSVAAQLEKVAQTMTWPTLSWGSLGR